MKRICYLFFGMVFILLTTACDQNADVPDNPDDAVNKFLGTWHVSDQGARLNYNVTITKSYGTTNTIILNNFADLGTDFIGTVSGNNVIISKQQSGEYSVEGSGLYQSKTKMTFTYTLSDGIDEEVRNAIFSK